jgi:NADH-quinone oxidoreductase subunit M
MPHLLSWLLFAPVLGMLVLLFVPGRNRGALRLIANATALVTLGISLFLLARFQNGLTGFQFTERAAWIPALGIDYSLGVDGISLLLVLLTTVITPLALLASWNLTDRAKEYYSLFLLLETGVLGVFLALDAFLFYVFFEAVLIPMYFIIGIWGGPGRLYAAIKFFLYTLTGSVLMLLGLLALYFMHYQQYGFYSFEFENLLKLNLSPTAQQWIFWSLFCGFAIKVPMFPFHTWLPDAHVEAPTAGSVVLASLLLKMGTYGFIRFSVPLLPVASSDRLVVTIIAALSIIAIIYGALVSLMQRDWKKLIAYSSISHMGFCTIGIFSLNPAGLVGSVIQQLNHGITTGLLFLLVGIIYERRQTREIAEFGGVAQVMPRFAVIFAIAALASAGLPFLNGFVGEFTILQGVFLANRVWAAFVVVGIVLAAAYLLWLYQRTMLGEIRREENLKLADLNARELLMTVPLVIWAIAIGVYPKPYFDLLDHPVQQIVERVQSTQAGANASAR